MTENTFIYSFFKMDQPTKVQAYKHFLAKKRKIIILQFIVSGFLGILCLVSCQNTSNKNLPIIDMHMHSYPVDYMGEPNIPNPITGRSSGIKSDEELMLATLSEMRRYNIIKQ